MGLLSVVKGAAVAAKVFAVANAPLLLAGSAVVGVVVTAYSAYKAGKKSQQIIAVEERSKGAPLTKKERRKKTWRLWLPIVVMAILTIFGVGASYYIQYKRLAYMTEACNLLMATNQELQYKLDKVIEKYPDAQGVVDEIDKQIYCSETVVNAESEVSGTDLFYDPFFKIKWWSSYDYVVEAIADIKESFLYSGYADTREMYDRFKVKLKDRGEVVNMPAWKDDSCPGSSKVPRINLRPMPLLDDHGIPIKGQTMYVLCYNPPDVSANWDMYHMNRPYGIDGPAWEDSFICEDEYDEIERQYNARHQM
jgi:hypothetical protein